MSRPDVDERVREAVYGAFAATGKAPALAEIAARAGTGEAEVREAYARLRARRVLVPAGDAILMAPPFSGIPTQHRVRVGEIDYHANCSWDALGVAAALHAEAVVHSRCEQTLEPLTIPVGAEGPAPVACVAHFAVPAARWWEDIEHT